MSISVPLADWGPRVRAQVQKFAARWTTFSWGTYPGHDPSEALATDGMVPDWDQAGGKIRGRSVAQAIWNERAKNGIWYVIHWGEIISTTRPEKGWLPYFARNNPDASKSHHNHVHTSWHRETDAPPLPTAPGPTTRPPVVKPSTKPYDEGWVPDLPWVFYLDLQHDGVKQSTSVWLLQKALGIKPYDGTYNAGVLRKAVSLKQKQWGNDPRYRDGVLGPLDAAKLFGDRIKVEASSK